MIEQHAPSYYQCVIFFFKYSIYIPIHQMNFLLCITNNIGCVLLLIFHEIIYFLYWRHYSTKLS